MPAHDISCGLNYAITNDVQTCISEASLNKYSFVVFPIVHPRFKRHHVNGSGMVGGFTRSDMVVANQDWTVKVVGKISQHLDVDAPSLAARKVHEDCMNEELSYCRGLGLPATMIAIKGVETVNLSRLLLTHFNNSQQSSILWVHIPMVCKKIQRTNYTKSGEVIEKDAEYNAPWLWWTLFHERMGWDKRVGLALELSADLPSPTIIRRWLGEPIKVVFLPTSLFITDKQGYPMLSHTHQRVLLVLMEHDAQVVISGARRCTIECYSHYLHGLWTRTRINFEDPMLNFAKGWEDYLQTPLQPLADNLDTHTYDIFEKDPIKYSQYQRAIIKALKDLKKKHRENNDSEKKKVETVVCKEPSDNEVSVGEKDDLKVVKESNKECEESIENKSNNELGFDKKHNINTELKREEPVDCERVITVMVLGAGRGPLVRAALNAADITKTKVKVLAIEKNPCAVVVLSAQVREMWFDRQVEVVSGDMRHLTLSPKADIIVSELLGSWGDNELSPECLDGASGLLSPEGICIPKSYTSYAAPITSPRLWAAAKGISSPETKGLYSHREDKNHETLWVVYMKNKYDIAEPKPLFTFMHPAKSIVDNEGEELKDYRGLPLTDNRRTVTVSWKAEQESVMHGFGGYFDCALYGGEMLSILPSTHSPGMISWFPVFIPIKTPIRVQKGDEIKATFWRCTSPRRVWYEWCVQVGNKLTPIHNSNGLCSEMLL